MHEKKTAAQSSDNGRPDSAKSWRDKDQRIKVRQVTNYQASWAETELGEEGVFTLQLILITAWRSTYSTPTPTTWKSCFSSCERAATRPSTSTGRF